MNMKTTYDRVMEKINSINKLPKEDLDRALGIKNKVEENIDSRFRNQH